MVHQIKDMGDLQSQLTAAGGKFKINRQQVLVLHTLKSNLSCMYFAVLMMHFENYRNSIYIDFKTIIYADIAYLEIFLTIELTIYNFLIKVELNFGSLLTTQSISQELKYFFIQFKINSPKIWQELRTSIFQYYIC